MIFKKLYFEEYTLFQENMINLGFNIYKIKYFYEEDQLQKLSRLISDHKELEVTVTKYQDAAEEAEIYLKAVAAFLEGSAFLPEHQLELTYLMNYFTAKEEELYSSELENEEVFFEWLQNTQ